MNYTADITIARPVHEVVALFDNPDNLSAWMDGLQSFEHLSGIPGEPGAQSRLRFHNGKREIEMIETVTARDLPRLFAGTYEAPGVFNTVRNSFLAQPDGTTRYVTRQEFLFQNVPLKMMGFLMPWAFKRQTMKYLRAFKDFAEAHPAL